MAPYFPPGRGQIHYEAGHAVAFWHHGWRFRYVTLRPRAAGHAAHLVVGWHRRIADEAGYLAAMQTAAAGQIAERRFHGQEARTEWGLRRDINDAVTTGFGDHDIREFVRMGACMDDEILTGAPEHEKGPERWIGIWRDAERKITGDLWPAVAAVACMLEARRCLTCREVYAIADAAVKVHAA
jgi:hypothetical protein